MPAPHKDSSAAGDREKGGESWVCRVLVTGGHNGGMLPTPSRQSLSTHPPLLGLPVPTANEDTPRQRENTDCMSPRYETRGQELSGFGH